MMLTKMPNPPTGNLLNKHPDGLNYLFSHKRELTNVFSDVIGLLEISSLSLTLIDAKQRFFCLSSNPSLEYNLLDSGLWQRDGLYQTEFYTQCYWSEWQDLFNPEAYDSLHYAKLIRYNYPSSIAISQTEQALPVAYSFASKHHHLDWHEQVEELRQIGDYCYQQLFHLISTLADASQMPATTVSSKGQYIYEKSA